MKKIVLMAFATLLSITVVAQNNGVKTITLTDTERTLVEQNSDFAFNLFRKARGTENYVISPLSITYALSMMNNSAEGITREEICQVLAGGQQTGYADVATMNGFCRKMITQSALIDPDTRVAIANTIYFNGDRNGISLKSAFKQAASTFYDATPSILRFSDEVTLDIINQWVSDQTDGMIHDLLTAEDMKDPNLVSFLLNAICFKGAWRLPFEEKNTKQTFFGTDNKHTAMMMWQVNIFDYTQTNLYQSVIMPYGNGAYQMTIFLPQEGKTLDDLLAALNGKNWNTAYYQDYEVQLSIPRIETDTNQNLEDIMSSLGMKNAFLNDNSHGFLDLCYFGDNEANSDACWISIMRQKAHLKLDEKGTEAAAATVIGAVDKAMPPSVSFTADKPFLYIISDYFTGSIFFIGQYMGEVTTGIDENVKIKELKKESIYNLQGQRINFLQKGLNIVDGKKVWVK